MSYKQQQMHVKLDQSSSSTDLVSYGFIQIDIFLYKSSLKFILW